VDGSVPTEENNHVRRSGRRHAYMPFNIRVTLEKLKISRRTSQTENSRRPHAGMRLTDEAQQRWCENPSLGTNPLFAPRFFFTS
jgi:hypothetical protein